MKKVKVLIPFHNSDTKKDQVKGDVIEVSDEKLARIREINVNMVLVLGDVKMEEESVENIEEIDTDEELVEEINTTEESVEEIEEIPAEDEEVKKPKAKKTKK